MTTINRPVKVSIYGGHNASVSYQIPQSNGTRSIKTIELERLRGERYYMLFDKDNETFLKDMRDISAIAKEHWGVGDSDVSNVVLYGMNGATHKGLLEELGCQVKQFDHHKSHAACSFGQSGYDEAIVVSVDGGGNDGVFNVYHATKAHGGKLTKLADSPVNLGHSYMLTGYPVSEIKGKKGSLPYDLSIAGKLMGLAAYGNINANMFMHLCRFYGEQTWNVPALLNACELPSHNNGINVISGQESYNLAHNSQLVLVHLFYDIFINGIYRKLPAKYKQLPLCLTGGVALNVLLNQTLLEILQVPIYIPPNPDDSGLSMGQLFLDDMVTPLYDEPTFNGMPWVNVCGNENLPQTIFKVQNYSIADLTERIVKDGAIVGMVDTRGSEIGPRALGHRSIVCLPSIPGMKDTLNAKVKFRESFRPFAPFCLDQDAPGYFVVAANGSEAFRFMSHAPLVRTEYRSLLGAITHQDGTSRLQTVPKDGKGGTEVFAAILHELRNNHPNVPSVLLNTSFNIKGKPILSRLSDALNVLETTQLDYVFVSDGGTNPTAGTLYGKRKS